MRPLRNLPLLPLSLSCALLVVGGCGSATTSPGDPAPSWTSTAAPPTRVPPSGGAVTGQGTVIEVPGGAPELCLGPIRESFPPQCEGTPLSGWSWEKYPAEQTADSDGPSTSWGSYAVTGTFDGVTLNVTGAVPLALYDVAASPSPRPVAPPRLTDERWAAVEAAVAALPGVLSVVRETPTGPVYATVVHDDGTFADWAVAAFGPGAVLVTSALR